MSNQDNIIHVTVHDGTEDQLIHIRNFMEDALEDYPGNGKIIVSDADVELHELPALDDFADELADRVAKRLE